jgi:ribosome biogenesis protein ERB1
MASTDKKRKRTTLVTEEVFPLDVNLESLDDEHDQSDSEEDNEVHSFPSLDVRSDSEDEDEEEEVDEEDVTEEEEEGSNSSDVNQEFSVFPKPKTVISGITGQPKREYPPIEPDYDTDSSTEDVCIVVNSFFVPRHSQLLLQAPNRVGDIPMHWYDDLPHVGYDVNGKKVLRPARGDELDKFLETVEDPLSWLELCSPITLVSCY